MMLSKPLWVPPQVPQVTAWSAIEWSPATRQPGSLQKTKCCKHPCPSVIFKNTILGEMIAANQHIDKLPSAAIFNRQVYTHVNFTESVFP